MRKAPPKLLVTACLSLMLTSNVEARFSFGGSVVPVAAAIFRNNDPENLKSDVELPKTFLAGKIKPPPPPPPSALQKTTTDKPKTNPPPPPPKPSSTKPAPVETEPPQQQQQPQQPMEPEATAEWSSRREDQSSNLPYDNENDQAVAWAQHDHQWSGSWGVDAQYVDQPQSYPGYHNINNPNNPYPSLEERLQDSAAREHDLMFQIQNLTETIHILQQQDQLHLRQMDLLTERIMEAESQIAREQNSALEYQANSTELGRQIAALQMELTQAGNQCAEFAAQHAKNENVIKELKKELNEARAEAENLAISIENSRIRDQMDTTRRLKMKHKSRGFFGWLWSFIVSPESEMDVNDLQSPQDLAKSTLLRALQIERNNVDELEAIVNSLQQNNSAIAEVVKSRDMIINELNDRVAVFEEDKVVLKAALKQLQKEMKEEAPRTEKLIVDLEAARRENSRLAEEIENLFEMHQNEINSLQHSIADAQNAANASESNLTAIGQYVDTLEQRLASFAIIRRDVEVREQQCKEIEEHAQQVEEERDNLRAKIEEFEVEQSDLKGLFEELVQEQTNLRNENARLNQEKDSLTQGAQRSREALAHLENSLKKRNAEITEWMSKAMDFEKELNSTRAENTEIKEGMLVAQAGSSELKNQIEAAEDARVELQSKMETLWVELNATKDELKAKSSELEQSKESMESATARLRETQEELNGVSSRLEQREKELEAQRAELSKLLASVDQKGKTSTSVTAKSRATSASESEEGQGVMNATRSFAMEKTGQNRTRLPPPLPGKTPPPSRKPQASPASKRKVPLRPVRKLFAKVTGIHGAFTPPSSKGDTKGKQPRPRSLDSKQTAPLTDTQKGSSRLQPPPPQRRQP